MLAETPRPLLPGPRRPRRVVQSTTANTETQKKKKESGGGLQRLLNCSSDIHLVATSPTLRLIKPGQKKKTKKEKRGSFCSSLRADHSEGQKPRRHIGLFLVFCIRIERGFLLRK